MNVGVLQSTSKKYCHALKMTPINFQKHIDKPKGMCYTIIGQEKRPPVCSGNCKSGDLSVDQKFGQLYYSTNRAICQQGLVTFNKKEDKLCVTTSTRTLRLTVSTKCIVLLAAGCPMLRIVSIWAISLHPSRQSEKRANTTAM